MAVDTWVDTKAGCGCGWLEVGETNGMGMGGDSRP